MFYKTYMCIKNKNYSVFFRNFKAIPKIPHIRKLIIIFKGGFMVARVFLKFLKDPGCPFLSRKLQMQKRDRKM